MIEQKEIEVKERLKSNNYSSSTNIIRDKNKELVYIPTENGRRIASNIIDSFNYGNRCFNIIGSYGTGKSTFLLALEQSLELKTKDYFSLEKFSSNHELHFISAVGSYSSIISCLSESIFNDKKHKLKDITKYLDRLSKQGKTIFIFVDELGKCLEYASHNNPEQELYYFQELAEYCNDTNHKAVLISTLHQNFNEYSSSLSNKLKQEWEKVKGRFQEQGFNEPEEHLLHLASSRIKELNFHIQDDLLSNSIELFERSLQLPKSDKWNLKLAQLLAPLDLLSAYILSKGIKKYAQNERSLFNFIEDQSSLGLLKHCRSTENSFYALSKVYDYFIRNFSFYIYSRENLDYQKWMGIQNALERAEVYFEEPKQLADEIIKTIGLLNILGVKGAIVDDIFLSNYCTSNNESLINIINNLEKHKIIRFRKFSNGYHLFEGSDLDIEVAIQHAAKSVSSNFSIAAEISKHLQNTFFHAKRISYEKGTQRFFKLISSDNPIIRYEEKKADGIVNLIFNNVDENPPKSENKDAPIIYGVFNNTEEIKILLYEIKKIEHVIAENQHDKFATIELRLILNSNIQKLHEIVNQNIYSNNKLAWFNNQGKQIKSIKNFKSFNQELSKICDAVYSGAPIFNNELINRERLSGAISSARKNLISALLEKVDQPDLGFSETKFPPEKSIYFSLIEKRGIHQGNLLIEPKNKDKGSFKLLWNECNQFLDDSLDEKQNISKLYSILEERPFGLRKGFLDFWIPIFLIIKKENFALFDRNGFIPYLTKEVLSLVMKKPTSYWIKSYDNSKENIKMLENLRSIVSNDLNTNIVLNTSTVLNTIKPYIAFARNLNPYTGKTKKISVEAQELYKRLISAKDPYDVLTVGIPESLNVSKSGNNYSQRLISKLRDTLAELSLCYPDLLKKIKAAVLSSMGVLNSEIDHYVPLLEQRFYLTEEKEIGIENVKLIEILHQHEIDSSNKNRELWIEKFASRLSGKQLKDFTDLDEEELLMKIPKTIRNLIGIQKIYSNKKVHPNEYVQVSFLDNNGNERNIESAPLKEQMDKINAIRLKLQEAYSASGNENSELYKHALISELKKLDK